MCPYLLTVVLLANMITCFLLACQFVNLPVNQPGCIFKHVLMLGSKLCIANYTELHFKNLLDL